MVATIQRRHGKTPDPLIVAAEESGLLSSLIEKWKEHIGSTDPHPFRNCAECKRLYGRVHKAHSRVGFRILERVGMVPRQCAREGCGNEFTPSNGWQRYCSGACRQAAYERRKSGKRDR